MSVKWIDYVWKHSPYKGFTLLVHLALADYARDTGECWPRQKMIAEKTRLHLTRVNEAIQQMSDDGYLTKSRGEHGSGYTYWLQAKEQTASESDSDAGESDSRDGEKFRTAEVEVPHSGKTNFRTAEVEVPHSGSATRTVSEPSGESSGRTQSPAPAGRARETVSKGIPPEGTHGWVVYRFEEERQKRRAGTARYNKGHLHSTIKSIRDDGYANDEIVMLIETFFVKYEWDIRGKVKEFDLVALFAQVVPQLIEQCESRIRDKRLGRKSAAERSREQRAELRSRMTAWAEERKAESA